MCLFSKFLKFCCWNNTWLRTSPVFPKLNDENLTDTPLSYNPGEEELAWVGSLLALGAFIGL